jgi:hypothetical protein
LIAADVVPAAVLGELCHFRLQIKFKRIQIKQLGLMSAQTTEEFLNQKLD